MTPEEIRLVQDSWKQVQAAVPRFAGLFYSKLFALDPSARALTRLDMIVPVVQDLGRRHAAYGVEDRHYTLVGAALVWTLEQELGRSFTAEVEQAWRTAYRVLSTTMKQAAASGETV